MDELDRLLWKKAVELSAKKPKCCAVNYEVGYVSKGAVTEERNIRMQGGLRHVLRQDLPLLPRI